MALLCAVLVSGAPRPTSWVIALVVVAFVASLGRPQAVGPMQFSVSAIVQVAAIPLIGPTGAGVVALVPTITDSTTAVKRIFNAAQRVLLVLFGSLAYVAVGGLALPARVGVDPLALAFDVAAAAAAAALMNAALLAGVLQRDSGGSLASILPNVLLRVGGSYAMSYVAAYLLVVLWSPAGLGWTSALFFLPSIVVIQWSLRQLAEEWAVRREVCTPFVTALDTRHPGAAESSRLAADAAKAIAAAVGVRPSLVDKVVVAAHLRDVGLLALEGKPAAIVRRDQAAASASVLGGIGFLATPLTYIAGHHERVDGQGRPEGLVGEQIPLGSRILAVADAWSDAVMAGRTAEEAVRLCESSVDSAWDEVCVNALRRAHGRGQLPAVVP
ncbi:HD-GYP domain-containing protein [Janibacter alittae]|uniref:HD domain-containing phosphohydrolase n=1 Tax=Janibacter alittae TaxID=3115209 RepID=A0ABZ2MJI9_9MICO